VNLSGSSTVLDLNGNTQSIASLSGVDTAEVKLGAGSLTVGDSDSTSFTGKISGASGCLLTKVGSGVLSVGYLWVPSGPATVNLNGGLLGITGLLGNSCTLNFNGGGLQFGLYHFDPSQCAALTFQAGGATFDTQTYDIAVSKQIGNGGPGGLTKLGSGTLILSASNTFAGPVNFNGGLIRASSLANLGAGTELNFNGGGLSISGGIFDPSVRTMTFLPGGAVLDIVVPTLTIANPIGNGGAGSLTKTGTGLLRLNALNTYTGETIVKAGRLELAGGIPAGGTSLIDIQSGTVVLKTVNVNKPDLDIDTAASTTFEIYTGLHTVGALSGSGTTRLDFGASLTAASITQGTITLAPGATLTIAAIPGGPTATSSIVPVPEPSVLAILSCAMIMGLSVRMKKRTR
jgi:fibronectin-binding autotransporter adhesin